MSELTGANLYRIKSGRDWFPFRRVYTKIVTKLDALFLADLINIGAMSEVDEHGWFFCSSNRLIDEWTEKQQETHMKSLKTPYENIPPEVEKKLKEDETGKKPNSIIQTEKRGIPGRRWVRVNLGLLEALIESYMKANPDTPKRGEQEPPEGGSGQVPPKRGEQHPPPKKEADVGPKNGGTLVSCNNDYKEKTEDTVAPLRGGDGVTPKPPKTGKPERRSEPPLPAAALPVKPTNAVPAPAKGPSGPSNRPNSVKTVQPPTDLLGRATTPPRPEERRAAQLRDLLIQKGKARSNSKTSDWALQFKRLAAEVDEARIDAVLTWYATAADFTCQFMPQAWSAKSFREKFFALEARMQRDSAPPPSPKTEDGDGPVGPMTDVEREYAAERRAEREREAQEYREILEDEPFWSFTYNLLQREKLLPPEFFAAPDTRFHKLPGNPLYDACRRGETRIENWFENADDLKCSEAAARGFKNLNGRFGPSKFHDFWWRRACADRGAFPKLAADPQRFLKKAEFRADHPLFPELLREFMGMGEHDLPDEMFVEFAAGAEREPEPQWKDEWAPFMRRAH